MVLSRRMVCLPRVPSAPDEPQECGGLCEASSPLLRVLDGVWTCSVCGRVDPVSVPLLPLPLPVWRLAAPAFRSIASWPRDNMPGTPTAYRCSCCTIAMRPPPQQVVSLPVVPDGLIATQPLLRLERSICTAVLFMMTNLRPMPTWSPSALIALSRATMSPLCLSLSCQKSLGHLAVVQGQCWSLWIVGLWLTFSLIQTFGGKFLPVAVDLLDVTGGRQPPLTLSIHRPVGV